MNKKSIYFLFLLQILPLVLHSFVPLDTISIKGDITLTNETITGNFLYTLKNNSKTPQEKWTFIIHPSVNILSVNHENSEADIDIQHGINFRLLTIKLSSPIFENTRSTIFIRFSINAQNQDPRMTISSNFVFLDARRFWFPYPNKDNQVNYCFIVNTSSNLYSVMGGKQISEATIIDKRITTWKNELPNISLSAPLIITDLDKNKNDFISVYTKEKNIADLISKEITPYWDIMSKHKYFPLSEIHVIPMDITIPNHDYSIADGEFLGNIFLIDNTLIQQLNTNTTSTAYNILSKRITETLIHELYHSYFPGLVKHNQKELLFIESLVQYLTWDLIASYSFKWGQHISLRSKFFLQNLYLQGQYNYLWNFLFDSSVLYGNLSQSQIKGSDLADTLVEKYRFIELSKKDILETILQYRTINTNISILNDTDILETITTNQNNINIDILLTNSTHFFNSKIEGDQTNFNIFITNQNVFRKNKIIEVPVQATFLRIEHNFPFTWQGQLIWETENTTNFLDLQIPIDSTWETNILEKIKYIKTKSSLDILEETLNDNIIMVEQNIGSQIIQQINIPETNIIGITMSENSTEKIAQWDQNDYDLIWDDTSILANNFIIKAFLTDNNSNKLAYLLLTVIFIDGIYHIIDIQDPE